MYDPLRTDVIQTWLTNVAESRLPAAARTDHFLIVLADRQELIHYSGGRIVGRYAISTAARGLGEVVNSWQTPRGWHRVDERVGDGLPLGALFTARQFNGVVLPKSAWQAEAGDGDKILTRIMRLRGLEPGKNLGGNVDTWCRMIYLHGTNHEPRLGSPASHGCIRLGNQDIEALFQATADGVSWCWIGTMSELESTNHHIASLESVPSPEKG
ncbi:MAG: L,D-transpeptidase [Kiritimatiellae bacterium]|nr:L,D-transpeptidase [Kiritimatiellia bacterium]